jgi:hypothetical protein
VGDQVITMRNCSGVRYLGAFEWRFDETIYEFYLISSLDNKTRAGKLIYVNDTAEIELVVDQYGYSMTWISVCADTQLQQIAALGLHTTQTSLQVRWYTLKPAQDSSSRPELVPENASHTFDSLSYKINSNQPVEEWLWYSHVATCTVEACRGTYLAAAVRGAVGRAALVLRRRRAHPLRPLPAPAPQQPALPSRHRPAGHCPRQHVQARPQARPQARRQAARNARAANADGALRRAPRAAAETRRLHRVLRVFGRLSGPLTTVNLQ